MEKIIFLDHRTSSFLNSGSQESLLRKDLFAISFEFATDINEGNANKRKRKNPYPGDEEVLEWEPDDSLKSKLQEFVAKHAEHFVTNSRAHDAVGNAEAKAAAASCPSTYFFHGCKRENFKNDSGSPKIILFQNREFLLPPNSYGLLGTLGSDVTSENILKAANDLYGTEGGYDLVIMDPPWMNKSVKRQHRYMTGSSKQILSLLPMGELLSANGLLVVWCTHNVSHYRQLKDHLNNWNLRILANWTWLKVTTSGAAICPFERNFKKPYEHLLLAARPSAEVADRVIRSDRTIIVSVPSAVHSHKPHLDEPLGNLLGVDLKNFRCLELFARSMKSKWVCAGNEVVKLQCSNLFDSTPRTESLRSP